MDSLSSEKLVQRSIENLSQLDTSINDKELESIEKYLKTDAHFLAAINSSELLNLLISIFVTSITSMATISNVLSSSSSNASSKKYN